jgi:hypothetical protein
MAAHSCACRRQPDVEPASAQASRLQPAPYTGTHWQAETRAPVDGYTVSDSFSWPCTLTLERVLFVGCTPRAASEPVLRLDIKSEKKHDTGKMPCIRCAVIACLSVATGAFRLGAQPTPGPSLAPASPGAIVTWGQARFTVLTPSLLRMELAGRTGAFDDRPSLAVINRVTVTPPFSVSTEGATLYLRTASLNLTYTSPSGNSTPPDRNSSMCSRAEGADVADGTRVPAYPGGLNASSQGACCAACDADTDCTAWVYAPITPPLAAPSPLPESSLESRARPRSRRRVANESLRDVPGANCWLLFGVTALNPSGSRVAGAVLPFSSSDLNVSFAMHNAVGPPVAGVWHAGDADPLNLLGAFHAMDCYDTPANCTRDYAAGAQPGLVSRAGWALLDDTAAARLVPPNPDLPSPTPFWYANQTAASGPAADWYLLAPGLDFCTALADYVLIGGGPALAPSSAYGVWWSHWQAFSQVA